MVGVGRVQVMSDTQSSIVMRRAMRAAAGVSWWRRGWQTLCALGAFLYWGVFGLLFTVVSWVLCWLLPRRCGTAFGRRVLHWAFRVFVRYLRVTGLVHVDMGSLRQLRECREPLIIAPNHTSLWDAVFVIACLPRAICIMKESILRNPFLGGGARLAGYLANRSPSKLVREASDALEESGQLLLFPEGTRTRRDARWINPLKGGCALVSRRAGVPIVPVFIRTNSRFLEKDWPLWKRPTFPIRMSFELGERIEPREGESAQEMTQRLEQVFEENLSRPHKLRRRVAADDGGA